MRKKQLTALLSTVAASALAATAAMAQDDADGAGSQSVSAQRGSDEIIVTAQRRESTVQETPLTIAVATGDALRASQITDPTRITNITTGVQLFTVGKQLSLYVRGAGAPVAQPRADPAAAYSVDGVALARPLSVNGSYFDVARIEILKGPQGTLYGRNSTVGAVNVITNRPTFEFGGHVGVEVGNYDLIRTEGALNVPLSETFAVRGAFQTTNRDGYLSNGYLDAENYAGRIRTLWEPSDDVSLMVNASYFQDTGQGAGDIPISLEGTSLFADHWFVQEGPPNFSTQVPTDGFEDFRNWLISAELEADLGFATLTVIPGYLDTEFEALTYTGGFEQRLFYTDKQTSVEVRLASPGDQRLSWIVGGLYLNNEQDGIQNLGTRPGILQGNVYNAVDLESFAAFGQLTYALTDQLRLTGGIRYSNETKDFDAVTQDLDLNEVPLPPGPGVFPPLISMGHRNFEDISYRAGVEYDVADNSLLYANIATGYKAGGFNVGAPPNTYEPETMRAITVGAKNTFADGQLRLNIEGWHWTYRDVQQVQFNFVNPPPFFALVTFNAAKQESYGVELDGSLLVGEGGLFNANITYTNSQWKEFALPGFVFGPFNIPPFDLSGEDTLFAPRWAANLSYQHRFELPGGAALIPSARTRLRTAQTLNTTGIPGSRVDGTTSSDASLTYESADGAFEAQAYVNNIENELVFSFSGVTPAGHWGTPRAPRTYGIRLFMRF